MGKEKIECVLCKTYSHPVLSVATIMLPLPSVCLWRVAMRALTVPCITYRADWEPEAPSGKSMASVPGVVWRCPVVLQGPSTHNPAWV